MWMNIIGILVFRGLVLSWSRERIGMAMQTDRKNEAPKHKKKRAMISTSGMLQKHNWTVVCAIPISHGFDVLAYSIVVG